MRCTLATLTDPFTVRARQVTNHQAPLGSPWLLVNLLFDVIPNDLMSAFGAAGFSPTYTRAKYANVLYSRHLAERKSLKVCAALRARRHPSSAPQPSLKPSLPRHSSSPGRSSRQARRHLHLRRPRLRPHRHPQPDRRVRRQQAQFRGPCRCGHALALLWLTQRRAGCDGRPTCGWR